MFLYVNFSLIISLQIDKFTGFDVHTDTKLGETQQQTKTAIETGGGRDRYIARDKYRDGIKKQTQPKIEKVQEPGDPPHNAVNVLRNRK